MKRRRLGQHYLVDRGAVRQVVAFASIKPSERVLEIGTGEGSLTGELVGLGKSFVGYEVDPENFDKTREVVRGSTAEIRLGSAFEERPEFDVLVSSLPYSESATFVEWLSSLSFRRAVVVLQDDFVQKLLALPGDRNYRGISALAQIAFRVKELGRINRGSFRPPPKVNSVIVSFTPNTVVSAVEAANIFRLFSLRRKEVGSALTKLGMKANSDYGRRRVYGLRPEEVHELCRTTDTA